MPKNNLQSTSDLDKDNKSIPIPKIKESEASPVTLFFDAKTDEWCNITELYKNDKIIVALYSEKIEQRNDKDEIIVDVQNITFTDIFTKNENKKVYSLLCGRYSIYGGSYVSNCQWITDCYDCNCHNECVTAEAHLPWFYGAFGECAGD